MANFLFSHENVFSVIQAGSRTTHSRFFQKLDKSQPCYDSSLNHLGTVLEIVLFLVKIIHLLCKFPETILLPKNYIVEY